MSENQESSEQTQSWGTWRYGGIATAIVLVFGAGLLAGSMCFTAAGDTAAKSPDGAVHEHAHGEHEVGDASSTVWTCSMHPDIRKDKPGKCPICGMDLIRADSTEGSGDSADPLAPNEVELSERAQTIAQIRTTEVKMKNPSGVTRRLLGRVQPAETRTRRLTAWTAGRLDRLAVSEHGVEIRRGQKIAEIYSPEIYAAHRELLAAKNQLERLADRSSSADTGTASENPAVTSASSTLEAARRRLELLGIGPKLLDKMQRAKQPWKQVPIRAQFGGTVTDLKVREGDYVKEGEVLYRLADLNEVWVELDAYESDLSQIERGQRVEFRVPALPGRTYEGQISFVDAVVDDQSRTAQVRVVIDNREGRLKPGMWVEAELFGGEAITGRGGEKEREIPVIPESAALFAGERSIVYVEQPETEPVRYAAREVRLGSKVGDVYPVMGGLQPGERVVTHGAFVLDADLQIRGGRSMMARGDDASRPDDEMLSPSPAFRSDLRGIADAYLQAKAALAGDDSAGARDSLSRMAAAVSKASPVEESVGRAFDKMRSSFQESAAPLLDKEDADIGELRRAFEAASHLVKEVLRRFGNPTEAALRVAHCPMAFDGDGADWVQTTEVIKNPYFGSEMHSCGRIKQSIAAGQYLMEASNE